MRLLSSLTNRVFLFSAFLAIAPIGLAVLVVNALVTQQAERELERGLDEAGTLVEQYRTASVTNLAQQARLVADLPKFKAVVELNHPPTLQPVAVDYRRQIASDLFVVTNRRGDVLAAEGLDEAARAELATWPALRRALDGHESTSFVPRADSVVQVVTVPIAIDPRAPEILGTLTVGIALDEHFAARIKRLTDSEIAFGLDGRVRASTFPESARPALAAVLGGSDPGQVLIDGQEYVGLVRPLAPGSTDRPSSQAGTVAASPPPGFGATPVALIFRSRTERLRFLGTLHRALGAMAVGVLLLATLLSYLVSRTITRPLAEVTRAMRDTASTGDLTTRLDLPTDNPWDDEDARLLATTFNTMTASIARFQREARQRERLSSLGRLSTVVAHEIRNPLMIIKTALRSLRRSDLPPERLAAAVTDIDEEVSRLNRVVNEVLDFARPIRFDLAPASLRGICEGAVAAAAAAGPAPPCRLAFDPGADAIVTDAERLHVVLVNLLTNAAQAVAHAGSDGRGASDAAAAIEVVTQALDRTTVRVVVRDRGAGISDEDLPRIFEPYFTTKRTGTGIGLAITRNIVDGLGGTISAHTRRGEGTDVIIDLPRTPPIPGPTTRP